MAAFNGPWHAGVAGVVAGLLAARMFTWPAGRAGQVLHFLGGACGGLLFAVGLYASLSMADALFVFLDGGGTSRRLPLTYAGLGLGLLAAWVWSRVRLWRE